MVNLTPDDVAFVNRTVQIYAQRYIFFRNIRPVIDDAFRQNMHMEFEYHAHPRIDELDYAAGQTYFGSDNDFYPPDQAPEKA